MNPLPQSLVRALWLVGLALAALAVISFVDPAHAAPATAGEVIASTGDSRLLRANSIKSPVTRGTRLIAGDLIKTGPSARLQLRFVDGAAVSLGPSTEFRIEAYQFEPKVQQAFFELVRGFARTVSGAIGKTRHEDYRLRTATAVIGIRGTDFATEQGVCRDAPCTSGAAAGLKVTVYEGRVAVSNASGTVDVPKGKTLFVGSARSVPEYVAAPAAERRPLARSGAGRVRPGAARSRPETRGSQPPAAGSAATSDDGPSTMRFMPR